MALGTGGRVPVPVVRSGGTTLARGRVLVMPWVTCAVTVFIVGSCVGSAITIPGAIKVKNGTLV